jgi:hypothetical protein
MKAAYRSKEEGSLEQHCQFGLLDNDWTIVKVNARP